MTYTPDSTAAVNKANAIAAMHRLFAGDFDGADAYFHEDATWWILGQGSMSYARIKAITQATEGGAGVAELTILGALAEGNSVSVEAVGDMELGDGRRYANHYHHLLKFRDGRIFEFREYLDTAYVRDMFGENLYENNPEIAQV